MKPVQEHIHNLSTLLDEKISNSSGDELKGLLRTRKDLDELMEEYESKKEFYESVFIPKRIEFTDQGIKVTELVP
jgi:hypothetical protein